MAARKSKIRPILTLLLLLSFLVASYFFLHSSYFLTERVYITGNQAVSSREILLLSGIQPGVNIFDIHSDEVAKAILVIPRIKSVDLTRHLPNEIEIHVVERQPWALVVHKKEFLVIDNESVCLEKTNGLKGYDLPLITLSKLPTRVKEGRALNASAVRTVEKIMSALPPYILTKISDYHCASDGQVFIYTTDGTEIRFGGSDRLQQKVSYISQAIALANRDHPGSKLLYIDLRYKGYPVIRFR